MAKIYSHSRLSCFEQCPYRFKLKYIDKIIPEIEMSIEAHLGKCVHDTLEWIYNKVLNKEQSPAIENVIDYYAEKWQEAYSEKIKIVKTQFTQKDYFNKGVQFLVDYYMKHQPFKDGTLECEKKIIINLDSDGEYKMQGFIDRLVHNIEQGHFEIHDYKTANTLPTQEKIEQDRQLALYSIAIKELYGEDKDVKLIWHYLAHNTKIVSNRTNEQLENLKRDILKLIKKIESTNHFPTSRSVLCGWCEYKSMCKEFGGVINEHQKNISDIFNFENEVTDDKILEEQIKEESETNGNGLDIW